MWYYSCIRTLLYGSNLSVEYCSPVGGRRGKAAIQAEVGLSRETYGGFS